ARPTRRSICAVGLASSTQTFKTAAAPTRCVSTAPRINAAHWAFDTDLLQGEYIEVPALRDRFDGRIVGHFPAPDRPGAAPASPHRDILLAIHQVGGGNADNAGAELRARPQDLPGLGVEGHEMAVGAAAEHQAARRGERRAGPGQVRVIRPDLFAGIDVHGLHRTPVVGGRIVLYLEGFI